MNTLEILKATRQLLANREHWTKRAYSRNSAGRDSLPKYSDSVCFCLAGAMWKASGLNLDASFPLLQVNWALSLNFGSFGELIGWNDNPARTHDEVLARLDAAIAKLETSNKENGCGNG